MRKTRIDRRITIRELSQQTGISASRICDLEQGRAEPTGNEVDQIAMVLGNKIKLTDSETAKRNKEALGNQLAAMGKVFEEVKRRGLGKGNGGFGGMRCPKCGAKLYFRVASINGHVWAKCSADGCLAWMQ